MADIQAEGLRAAGDLLERVLGSEPEGSERRRREPPASGYTELVDALDGAAAAHGRRAGQPGETAGLVVPWIQAESVPRCASPWRRRGLGQTPLRCGSTTVRSLRWGRFSCGPGSSRLRAGCSRGRVSFEPGEVEPLPPRSSRAVAVSLTGAGRVWVPARTGATIRRTERRGSGCRWRSTVGADRDWHRVVEAYSEDVSRLVRRAMLDAIPDGEPHRWLYRVARCVPEPDGQGDPPALCLAANAGVRRRGRGRPARRRRHRAAAQRVPRPRRHRRRQRAAPGSADVAGRVRRPASRSTPATRWRCSRTRCCAATRATLPDALADGVLDEFDTMALRTLEGQATELGWRRDGVAT